MAPALLTVYLDVSGTNRRDGVFSLAGFAATNEQWNRFDAEWRARTAELAKPFHMTEFEARRGEYADLREGEAKSLLSDLLDIVAANTTSSVAYATPHRLYDEYVPALVKKVVASPYWFAFLNLATTADLLAADMVRLGALNKDYRFKYVLANGDVGSGKILNGWMAAGDSAREARAEVRIESIGWAQDNGAPGLQAADLLAFEIRKEVQREISHSNRRPRFPLVRMEATHHRWNYHLFGEHLRLNADSVDRQIQGRG